MGLALNESHVMHGERCWILTVLLCGSVSTCSSERDGLKTFSLEPETCEASNLDSADVFARKYQSGTWWFGNKAGRKRAIRAVTHADPRYYYTSPATRRSLSGSGSDLGNATRSSLEFLASVINEYSVSSVIDIPCGDVN